MISNNLLGNLHLAHIIHEFLIEESEHCISLLWMCGFPPIELLGNIFGNPPHSTSRVTQERSPAKVFTNGTLNVDDVPVSNLDISRHTWSSHIHSGEPTWLGFSAAQTGREGGGGGLGITMHEWGPCWPTYFQQSDIVCVQNGIKSLILLPVLFYPLLTPLRRDWAEGETCSMASSSDNYTVAIYLLTTWW